jgi:SAM-dependent methyltransferase
LRRDQDAYGHALHDAFRGMHSHEILERSDGYIAVIGHTTTYFNEYRDWAPHERKAIRRARGRVLDIGCGAGRFMLYLQHKGLSVTGIDNSPGAIQVCRLRGLKSVRVMSVTQIGARLGRFDTILFFGGTFGLLSNARRGRWLLRRIHGITGNRGRIIAQSCDPHQMASFEQRRQHRVNLEQGKYPGEVRFRIRYKEYATPWQDWLVVSKKEMRQLLKGTGWGITEFINGQGSSYIAIIDKDCV